MKLEIISGPMYSGKSSELLRRLSRWSHIKPEKKILLFKPIIDTRGSEELVVSRTGTSMSCFPLDCNDVKSIADLASGQEDEYVIGLDEIQFFHFLEGQVLHLLDKGANIILAGLNRDYKQLAFKSVQELMPYADSIDVLTSVCHKCGKDGATETKRISFGKDSIEIDDGSNYEARHKWCL